MWMSVYVKNRWKYLGRRYRNAKNHPSKFFHFDQMKNLLGEDKLDDSFSSVDSDVDPGVNGNHVKNGEKSAGKENGHHQEEENKKTEIKSIESQDWTREETSTLIPLMSNHITDLENQSKRKEVFHQVSRRMIREGFAIDATSIEKRWKSLVTSYKKNKTKVTRTASSAFIFYHKMDALLGEKNQPANSKSESTNTPCSSEESYAWSYDETVKLIDLMSDYKEELKNPLKRKMVFETVTAMLNFNGVTVDAPSVENKWNILFGSYRKMKDKQTSDKQSRYLFYDTMDCSFGLTPKSSEYRLGSNSSETSSEIMNEFAFVFRPIGEIFKLIEIIQNNIEILKQPKKKKRDEGYELVAEGMRKKGYEVDAQFVRKQWKYLVRQYRDAQAIDPSRRGYLYDRMMEVLGDDTILNSDYAMNSSDEDCSEETDYEIVETEVDEDVNCEKNNINDTLNIMNGDVETNHIVEVEEDKENKEVQEDKNDVIEKDENKTVEKDENSVVESENKIVEELEEAENKAEDENDIIIEDQSREVEDENNFVEEDEIPVVLNNVFEVYQNGAGIFATDSDSDFDEEFGENGEYAYKILNRAYLKMKKEEYARVQQRHEERMDIERKKLKIMEDILKKFEAKFL